METELKPPVVTEDDVLRGSVEVLVERRDGVRCKVTVRAMPWRVALAVAGSMLPGEAMIQTVQTCVRAPAGDRKSVV
jgi:hypothetical protein